MISEYKCSDCPRKCNVIRRADFPAGFCMSPSLPHIYRAAPHFGEEPCISGERGSGAIFFSGCNLRCVFCQNHEISRGTGGKQVTPHDLGDIMLRLRDEGVHNINLVTASHYVRPVAEALAGISLDIPVVWNSSGYESAEALKMLEGLVQIYMPDFKYSDSVLAKNYSRATDYPEVAEAAIKEMFRQRGSYTLDENGMLLSGVLVRHLILPGETENSMNVIDFIADSFPPRSVLFSLMSQYTPMPDCVNIPKLNRRVTEEENEALIHYMKLRGIQDGFWQDTKSATDEMIPAFDLTGL